MKIGILTFHRADNYGAILQNYALQNILTLSGFQAVTIDYRSRNIEKWYQIRIIERNGGVLHCIKGTLLNCYNYTQSVKRKKAFDYFRKRMLLISNSVDQNSIKQILDDYDIFICGSDQVWNEKIIGKEDVKVYSLQFVEHKYKASYAASAGSTKYLSKEILSDISKLNYITVRETSLSNFLMKKKINAVPVCDPVFLMDKVQWSTILEPLVQKHNLNSYLLLYYIESHRKETCQIAKYIAKRKGLKIIYPSRKCKDSLGVGKCVYDDGPFEFVSDIAHADFVVASSFHAVAFSIIFHKEFVVILHDTTGDRVKDLLEKVGLEERIITGIEDYEDKENSFKLIDYSKVDSMLTEWRNYSLTELMKICSQSR